MDDRTAAALRAYATKKLLERLEAMLREAPGVVTGDDPEYLHRMRVASRRLRTAIRYLGSQAGLADIREFRRYTRRITQALGAARDLDVQILWLERFIEEGSASGELPLGKRVGACRVLLRLQQAREALQPRIAKFAVQSSSDGFLERVCAGLRGEKIRIAMEGATFESAPVRMYAFELLGVQLETFLAHSIFLAEPGAIAEHHMLRIEAKHLRYAMELFADVYDGALDGYIAEAKKMQGLLGELHDADVWIESVPTMAEKEKKRAHDYFGDAKKFSRLALGFDAIRTNRVKFREARYEDTAAEWRRMREAGTWRSLYDELLAKYREDRAAGRDESQQSE